MYCLHCGTNLPADSSYCYHCGREVSTQVAEYPVQAPVPYPYAYNDPYALAQQQLENKATLALLIEIVAGFLGFMGIGHIYSGRMALGITVMFGWWFALFMAIIVSAVSFGLLLLPMALMVIAVPIISGIQARNYVRRQLPPPSF